MGIGYISLMILSLFSQAGISLESDQQLQFEKLLSLFLAKNSQVNLSAIRDETGVIQRHFIDSLSIRELPEWSRAERVLDFGTGGGFPGLPLAIIAPEKRFTLLDATRKKLDAVGEFARELGLENVVTRWGRGEDAQLVKYYRNTFDLVTARAVTYLPDLLTLISPYVRKGGYLIAYKTPSDEELVAGQECALDAGMRFHRTEHYRLTDEENDRLLLVFEKIR